MIGDNPITDIQGGKAAGMRTIYVHGSDPSEADYTCKSLTEVLAILAS
jgi:putative hydrolase of the HAD superfamily